MGFTLSRLGAVVLALILVARTADVSDDVAWAMLAAAAVVTLSSSARALTALVGGALTWLLGTVFLADDLSEVSLGGPDATNLLLMLLSGALAAAVVLVRRRAQPREPRH